MSAWIRPAAPADVDRIARIHVDSWRETYTGLLPGAAISAHGIEQRRKLWARAVAGPGDGTQRVLVGGLEPGEILGFASAGEAAPGEPEPGPELGQELRALYCLRAGQGAGLGSALLAAALPSGPAFCWALSTNELAIGFSRARGFAPEVPPVTRGEDRPLEVRLVRR